MNLNTETLSDTRAKVVVTLTGEEVAAEEKAALREISSQARVPGFRPGKVPEQMVRRRYAKQITEEVSRKCVSKAYRHAVDEAGIKIYGLVDVNEPEIKSGQDVDLEFTFDLQPQFDLPEYKGIEAKVPPVSVTDEDVERELVNLRRSRAEYNKVERAAKAEDYVKVSYKGEIDGQPIAEIAPDNRIWGTQENTWEEAGNLGPDSLGVPAIIEGVVGMSVDETKEVTQEFGEDHEVEALRGKTGKYTVTVHEVRERILPELNEEFLKSIQVESVEQLKERIKEELVRRAENDRRSRTRNQIVEQLLKGAEFALPESAIETETQRVIERVMRENMQRGVPQEEFEKHKEELHAQSRQAAIHQLRRDFILGRIAEKENIKVEDKDMQRAVVSQAMRFRVRPEQFVKEIRNDREAIRSLQQGVLLDKTMEFLSENANLVEAEDAPAGEPAHQH